jgi:hypothetical protein
MMSRTPTAVAAAVLSVVVAWWWQCGTDGSSWALLGGSGSVGWDGGGVVIEDGGRDSDRWWLDHGR